ncbi:hypothetical protein Nepgr_032599 [Nepenthes gracilis]|uniref:Uncharacterized protein n=1 Tax=Nepenthes gracilis TaxID=150966 RepID=A0AAD3TKJ4_NEPGR|nr:hypothetical protein Nepgr_032599 [Nepenthes gracilis]
MFCEAREPILVHNIDGNVALALSSAHCESTPQHSPESRALGCLRDGFQLWQSSWMIAVMNEIGSLDGNGTVLVEGGKLLSDATDSALLKNNIRSRWSVKPSFDAVPYS